MRIEIHNGDPDPLFEVLVNPKHRPALAHDPSGAYPDVYLEWDGAVDDRGHLRKCPVCGCPHLFARKDFAPVTIFVLVLALALVAIVISGIQGLWPVLVVFAFVAAVDVMVFMFSGLSLVCYRCASRFRELPITRRQRNWDPQLAEGFPMKEMPVRFRSGSIDRQPDRDASQDEGRDKGVESRGSATPV